MKGERGKEREGDVKGEREKKKEPEARGRERGREPGGLKRVSWLALTKCRASLSNGEVREHSAWPHELAVQLRELAEITQVPDTARVMAMIESRGVDQKHCRCQRPYSASLRGLNCLLIAFTLSIFGASSCLHGMQTICAIGGRCDKRRRGGEHSKLRLTITTHGGTATPCKRSTW